MASNRSNQYRCAVGGEWKDISEFSRSQQRRARNNNRENSGMICMAHSQPSRAEIACTVCCRTRPIDQYSNNERKSENPRCQQCVAWDTDQEHGVTPIPLATGHVSIEEAALKRYHEPVSCSEFFAHEIPAAPITGPEALGLQSSESTNRAYAQVIGNSARVTTASETSSVVNETMSVTSSRATTAFPPHLKVRMERMTLGGNSASEESRKAVTSNQNVKMLPPHLRKPKPNPEQSSEVGTADSVSTATTFRKEKEKEETAASNKISYNAWDPKGVQHRATKDFTVASSSASAASTSEEAESQGRSNSKWPKASEYRISRAELQDQNQLVGRPAQSGDDDKERRKNYK
ncbi:hypothetical protein NW768_008788 [Fusarium equiseti]|uniref:Stc1 domain-containing protein n=1 Tax=Fusarium equiseti TaxID=61235 RepID=A0ABQ8R599_FUSEQ|nr:hypothetical protein NW768_008788 [Fusarium equiseti]